MLLAEGIMEGNTGRGYRFHRYQVVRAGLVLIQIGTWSPKYMSQYKLSRSNEDKYVLEALVPFLRAISTFCFSIAHHIQWMRCFPDQN